MGMFGPKISMPTPAPLAAPAATDQTVRNASDDLARRMAARRGTEDTILTGPGRRGGLAGAMRTKTGGGNV